MRSMYILRTDDQRATSHFEPFRTVIYLGNGSSDLPHVWFYGRVFEVGGSNVSTPGWTKSKFAAVIRLV